MASGLGITCLCLNRRARQLSSGRKMLKSSRHPGERRKSNQIDQRHYEPKVETRYESPWLLPTRSVSSSTCRALRRMLSKITSPRRAPERGAPPWQTVERRVAARNWLGRSPAARHQIHFVSDYTCLPSGAEEFREGALASLISSKSSNGCLRVKRWPLFRPFAAWIGQVVRCLVEAVQRSPQQRLRSSHKGFSKRPRIAVLALCRKRAMLPCAVASR
jgi:hypothetical protein